VGEFGWVVILLSYYVTSDTHFSHANIIRYCNRPFSSVEEMNAAMIDNWNSEVSAGDVVLHLGDVGFGPAGLACIQQCRGRKILIRGNHDRSFSNGALYRAGFEAVYKKHESPFVYYTPGGLVVEKHPIILMGNYIFNIRGGNYDKTHCTRTRRF
jgi:predicted phosphohydrolase